MKKRMLLCLTAITLTLSARSSHADEGRLTMRAGDSVASQPASAPSDGLKFNVAPDIKPNLTPSGSELVDASERLSQLRDACRRRRAGQIMVGVGLPIGLALTIPGAVMLGTGLLGLWNMMPLFILGIPALVTGGVGVGYWASGQNRINKLSAERTASLLSHLSVAVAPNGCSVGASWRF